MERGVPRRRRPRPVAGAGIEGVLARGDDLAKGWVLALVEDVPLEEAAGILSGEVARDGPRICDALIRALCDESDLRRIQRDGVLEPLVARAGELAGARSAEAAVHAIETLKDVVWSALRAELSQDDPDLLADAAERLALVTQEIRAAVLRRRAGAEEAAGRSGRVAALRVAPPTPSREAPRRTMAPEHRAEGSGPPGHEGTGGTAGAAGGEAEAYFGATGAGSGEEADEADTSVASARVREPLWIDALRDEIVTAGRSRAPLSLLLVELEEAERLVAVEPHGEAAATFGRFAQAVRTAVRRRDVLACETDSRAWVIARDTGRAGAQALGMRIAAAVPSEESWRGAPLTVSVGLAVLGEDGYNAASLIDAAEQTRFAAEASGIGIVTGAIEGDTDPPGPTLAS
jgi:GGDEF domain-containing protein